MRAPATLALALVAAAGLAGIEGASRNGGQRLFALGIKAGTSVGSAEEKEGDAPGNGLPSLHHTSDVDDADLQEGEYMGLFAGKWTAWLLTEMPWPSGGPSWHIQTGTA